MKRSVFIAVTVLLCHVGGGSSRGNSFSISGDRAGASSPETYAEMLRAKNLEVLHTVIKHVKEKGYVSVPDNSSLRSTIGALIQDKVLGLGASERQKLVEDTIGEDNYLAVKQILVKQLGSSDSARRESALRSLGYPLFVLEAVDQLKMFVFQKDRMTQLSAMKALVYLDVPGANHLLSNLVICGILNDYDTATAIHAFYISNDADIDAIAVALLKMNPGGKTFKTLLPILRERADYKQIVGEVFRTDMFCVPGEEDLSPEDQTKLVAEYELLREIFSDPTSFMTDGTIRQKVMMYASSRHHFQLYTMALLTLEKSGEEPEYFTDMRKDDSLPEEKKRVLDKVIARIHQGKRVR